MTKESKTPPVKETTGLQASTSSFLKIPPKSKLPIVLAVGILLLLSGSAGFLIAKYLYAPQAVITPPSPLPHITKPTPTPETTAFWKTFQNNDVTFKFPTQWEEETILSHGAGYSKGFLDPKGKYFLEFLVLGNYSQLTGKPYESIGDFISLSRDKVKILSIDGQEGWQFLPRAGSEGANSVSFFSKDEKFINTLSLQTGNTPSDTSEAEVKEGQKLFAQILSTFKFLSSGVTELLTCEASKGCTGLSCPESQDPLCNNSPICFGNKCQCILVCQ